MPSILLHVDMDAFFASVEMRSDPRLEGRPLVVGGGPEGRGVVTAASYPAREFGIHAGMPIAHARRRCSGLLVLPVDPGKVIHESIQILAVLDRLCPRVEAASIDEAYLEYPAVPEERWEEEAGGLARRAQAAIRLERRLPCSVGAAANKLQAKMAGALGKPNGVRVVPPQAFLATFSHLPVSVIPGVGPKTTGRLAAIGIVTVGDLASRPAETGGPPVGGVLSRLAHGENASKVTPPGEASLPKSAGHETTFARDVHDAFTLQTTLWWLADRVSRRLRTAGLSAGGVAVRFKMQGKRGSRQRRLESPTQDPRLLAGESWRLLERCRGGCSLRLVGVAALHLQLSAEPLCLFQQDRQRHTVLQVGDRLRDRFGERALRPAGACRPGRKRR